MVDKSIKINIKPLSTNSLWRGRKFKTPEYDRYIRELLQLLPPQINIDKEHINLRFHLKKKVFSKSDVDNLIKPVLDILKKKGIIEDDRYIRKITAEKVESEDYFIEIIENYAN